MHYTCAFAGFDHRIGHLGSMTFPDNQ